MVPSRGDVGGQSIGKKEKGGAGNPYKHATVEKRGGPWPDRKRKKTGKKKNGEVSRKTVNLGENVVWKDKALAGPRIWSSRKAKLRGERPRGVLSAAGKTTNLGGGGLL